MVDAATARGAIVAGDLVPLHSGMGPDFRLAERAYKDYPGLYTMVEIKKEDWGLLPQVSDPWLTALVSRETAVRLRRKGYIPGLIRSADASAEARDWSGWSATAEVAGVDDKARRWVYLHVFKPGQPAFNWLDPSYAAQRVRAGDVWLTSRSSSLAAAEPSRSPRRAASSASAAEGSTSTARLYCRTARSTSPARSSRRA